MGDVIPRDSLTIPHEEREGSDPDSCVRKSSRCFNECLFNKEGTVIYRVYIKMFLGIGVVRMSSVWFLGMLMVD